MFDTFVERSDCGPLLIGRFAPRTDLITELAAMARVKDCRRMCVVSALGTVCDVSLRNLKADASLPVVQANWQTTTAHGPFTLLALSGNLVPMSGEPVLRLHAVLGAEDGSVLGGRLDAATVYSSVEVVCQEIARSWVIRKPCEETGLAELLLADRTYGTPQ